MDGLRVGIVGMGRIGRLHAEHILQISGCHLVGVADQYLSKEWRLNNPDVAVYDTADGLLIDKTIDAVLICTPSDSHAALTIRALQSGKHVFCEKPLGLSADEIKLIMLECERSGCCLQVGFNRRFDSQFNVCRTAVQDGRLGTPYLLRITSYDPKLPSLDYIQKSGGLLMDMTIHDFDMARYIMNCEINQVFVNADCRIEPSIRAYSDVDTALISLKFDNGALGVIENCRQARHGYDQRLEIFGSQSCMSVENPKPNSLSYFDEDGEHSAPCHDFFDSRYKQAYQKEIQAFFNSIAENSPSQVGAYDGLQALRIAQAAIESLRTNQPIAL